ncbi:response regulator [candidate division KSB1 bacterium]|nr:response regulator [candidate division KSB1 bacterium]
MNDITTDDKVLFVDDEKLMLQTIRRGLLDESYISLFANGAEEAMEILKEQEVAVIVTDLKMPGMNGIELLNIVQEKYPEMTRIVLTGYYQVSTILSAINKGHIHRYLTKPWKMEEEFIPTIRQAIELNHIVKERRELIDKLTKQNETLKKQNHEITKLKEQAQISDENKTKILNHITKTILPYMTDVIIHSNKLMAIESKQLQEMGDDINSRGMEILKLLRKLEVLLEGKR